MRAILEGVLVGAGFLCLYGFTTTFEPIERDRQLLWRAGYGVSGIACFLSVAWLLRASIRADARRRSE